MAISSNSLFHATQSLDNLKSIIKQGFRVNYCLETLSVPPSSSEEVAVAPAIYFPMVSFSDIPLSEIDYITTKYQAQYIIGLQKAWGINNGLNPVLYTQSNSLLVKYLTEHQARNSAENDRLLRYILGYTKNYKGLHRKSGFQDDNTPYNEKEWRYIPTDEQLKNIGIHSDFTENLTVTEKYLLTQKIQKLYLKFNLEEIKYLIVNSGEDAENLIVYLQTHFKRHSARLISCIFTLNQINSDF